MEWTTFLLTTLSSALIKPVLTVDKIAKVLAMLDYWLLYNVLYFNEFVLTSSFYWYPVYFKLFFELLSETRKFFKWIAIFDFWLFYKVLYINEFVLTSSSYWYPVYFKFQNIFRIIVWNPKNCQVNSNFPYINWIAVYYISMNLSRRAFFNVPIFFPNLELFFELLSETRKFSSE